MSVRYQSGNVLFIILIAVILFATLSFAVTQSSRQGSGSISNEEARLVASRILNQLQSLRMGYMRVTAANGCADNEVGFYAPGTRYSNSWTAPNGVGNLKQECNVFSVIGGGAIPHEIPKEAGYLQVSANPAYTNMIYTWVPHRAYVRNIGRNYVTSSDFETSEHLVSIAFSNKDVCVALNDMLDVDNPGDNPPSGGYSNLLSGECLAGASRVCSVILRLGYPGNLPELAGKAEACFHAPVDSYTLKGPRYVFYSVLDPG
jgi:hypothetical protein